MDKPAVIVVTEVEIHVNTGLDSSKQTSPAPSICAAEGVVEIDKKFTKRAWSFACNSISNITLEPVLFLYAFGYMASQPIYGFMMMDKLCRQYCNYTTEQCQAYGMGENNTVDTEVKKAWASFDNYSNIVSTIPTIVYAVFMGSWSDVFGRKIPMAISFVGISLGYVVALLLFFVPSLPVWMLLLPEFMGSLTGGLTSLMVSACAYAADISENDNSRTIRFALYEVSISFGSAVSGLLSGILMQMDVPYYVCYSVSLGSMLIGKFIFYLSATFSLTQRNRQFGTNSIWNGIGLSKAQPSHYVLTSVFNTAFFIIVIRVRDLPKMADRPSTSQGVAGSLFTTKHISDSFKTLTKPRAGRTRLCIWLVIAIFLLAFSTECAEFQLIQKFFTNTPLRWSLSDYLFYISIFEFGCMAAAGIFIPAVKKVFQWRDVTFLIVACVFRIAYCYGLAIMSTTWMAYTFSLFDLLIYGVTIGPRVIISKLVADDEQGKMLSLFSVAEAVSPLTASIAGTAIFTATAEFWPGFFGIVEAYTMLVVLLLVVLVDYFMRSDERLYQRKPYKGGVTTEYSDVSLGPNTKSL